MLAAKLLFIDSYYFLLVQLLNDLYQQSLFVCSCSKRAQGSAIKHQQGINILITNCLIQSISTLSFDTKHSNFIFSRHECFLVLFL